MIASMDMKEEFSEFYIPTKQEFDELWAKCIFVLDTNVLLDLYRYSTKTSLELIDTLRELATSDRLWIPYQVAYEYNKNRLKVIFEERSKIDSISKLIDRHMKALKDDLKKEDRARKKYLHCFNNLQIGEDDR